MRDRRLPRQRRILTAGAAVLLVAGAVGVGTGVVASGSGPEAEVSQVDIVVPVGPEPSGEQVSLDVSVFTADGASGRGPAVVLAHGFGGSKDQLVEQARTVAASGFVALAYTARGFGESGGRIHLDSPDYEIADVSVLLDLLATRDDVQLDGDGDPRVGVAGGSYGGAVALMAAAYDDRVDAIVPAITWNDLSRSLFPQSAQLEDDGPATTPAQGQPISEPGVFKRGWAALLFSSGLRGGDSLCGRFDEEVCSLYLQAATTGRPSERMLELLRRSSPAPVLERISAPTLLLQGESDSLFPLAEADANARGIAAAGTTVAVRWVGGGHDAVGGVAATDELTGAALEWFDHHLRDVEPDPGTAFSFSLPPTAIEDDETPVVLGSGGYPGLDGAEPAVVEVALEGSGQPVVSPPGGEPSALTTLPGAGGALAAAADATGAGYSLAVLPGSAAVFSSVEVNEGFTVLGSPRVRLSVTSSATDATLFASVWVVTADGTATLPRRLVSPLRLGGLVPGVAQEVEVLLPASAYRVEAGELLRVVVSSTDQGYAVPADTRAYQVSLAGDQALLVPTADAGQVEEALSGSGVPLPLLVGVPVLLVAALAWALVATRRHRRHPQVAELAEVPLVVEGLTKSYASGLRAVDGVSWRAERGQVVGLLGPNGAGKTTTMRMLVGLISSDGGSIHVLGERVSAGAPVLSRVGALIEGPGFLPHLSGRENLRAYWAATGKPVGQAGLDEALRIAGLGTAVDRPVRSYSQGMRQRLGIAQAMLGLPELLLLDEPTNGLDPPQILAMRTVLADYAAAGRTVVVSSHLLAEVEQTCSHVVVMHRGRVVLAGAVADLVDSEDTTVVVLDGGDPEAAAALLGRLPGVDSVDVDSDGRVHVLGEARRSALVAELVHAGHRVSSVDGRRHLEEVFMRLIGESQPVQEAAVP